MNFQLLQNNEKQSKRREEDASTAKVALSGARSSKYFAKSASLLQTDYTIDAKSVLGLLPDRKLPRYGSLPRRPRQLEGREMSHDVLEDSDYPRASPNVSNPISSKSKALVPKSSRSLEENCERNAFKLEKHFFFFSKPLNNYSCLIIEVFFL